MKLDNHASIHKVSFQCLVDAYSGKVLCVDITARNDVFVEQIEIKPAESK